MLIPPLAGQTELAIIVRPLEFAVLEDTSTVPLEGAILRLSVRQLLLFSGTTA